MATLAEVREKNELVKREYWRYLKGPGQMSEKSIRSVEQAIGRFDDCMKNEDYRLFTDKLAEQFLHYLETHINQKSGKPLGLKSRYYVLRHVKKFFVWLSSRPGYKSRIDPNDALYLQLPRGEVARALAASTPRYPTLPQVRLMCGFPVVSEIDRRDRALIAFTALTGIRDLAVVTLRMGCYNPVTKEVRQQPDLGVKTKFSKIIYTTMVPLDATLQEYFDEWYQYLLTKRKFGNQDPLFPSTDLDLISKEHIAYEVKGVTKEFWADAGPMRRIFRERAKQMGLPYFYPHAFRHFVTAEVEQHISTPEEMKAFSQSLGHEYVATTFRSYGALEPRRINEVVRGMQFGEKPASTTLTSDMIKQLALEVAKVQKEGVI